MKSSPINFLILVCLVGLYSCQICGKISISSNNLQYDNDMVKDGIVSEKWTENTLTPIIIDNEKRVDYIYVNIQDFPDKLEVA